MTLKSIELRTVQLQKEAIKSSYTLSIIMPVEPMEPNSIYHLSLCSQLASK